MHEKKRKNTYNYIPRDISEETRTVLMTGAPGPPRSSLVAPFVGLVDSGRGHCRTRFTDGKEGDRIPTEARW